METNKNNQPDLRDMFSDFEPEPSDAVWAGLESKLAPTKPAKVVPWGWISVAAAVVLLILIGSIFYFPSEAPSSLTDKNGSDTEVKSTSPAPLPEIEDTQFANEVEQLEKNNSNELPNQEEKFHEQVFAHGENGSKPQQTSSPEKPDTTQEEPKEIRRPALQVLPLSLETIYLSQAEIPVRNELPVRELPAPEMVEPTDGLQGPGEDPLFGKIVNAGNALFNLPAEYSSTKEGEIQKEEFYADFRLIKIKKHKTYRN